MTPATLRTIRFVEAASALVTAPAGGEQIVLDTAWTPPAGDAAGVRSARPLIAAALRAHQPLAEAMRLLDGWAASSGIVDRLEVDGVSYWFRRRLYFWRWLHERLIWRWVLGELEAEGPIHGLDAAAAPTELIEMARLLADRSGASFEGPAPSVAVEAEPGWPAWRPIAALLWRLGLHPKRRTADARRRIVETREQAVAQRLGNAAAGGPGILVLTDPAVHQTVAVAGKPARIDPFLQPVIDAFKANGLDPVILEIGSDVTDEATWRALQLTGRERVLPGSTVVRGFADPSDDVSAEARAREVARRLEGSFPPLDVDGMDLGPAVVAELRAYAGRGLASELRHVTRVGRMLAALRPTGIVMINEYSRPEWIIAARRQEIPSAAIQHGIIHPLHAGYILPSRPPTLPLADRTYVFGPYEARLLTESSVYRSGEIAIGGSPRLDLEAEDSFDPADRAAIRRELRVAPDARLLVFSSTSSVAARSTVIAAALDALLDGPWPSIHLAIKLHPAEDDGTFYRALVEGLARSRGFAPPALSIVKAIDLYRLLRAADAHLGVYSTVLTDAVAAGTSNLIVTTLAGADLLGYAQAGVARPVRTSADIVAAMEAGAVRAGPEETARAQAARAAFLAEHFAPGPAGPRIAADIAGRFGPAT